MTTHKKYSYHEELFNVPYNEIWKITKKPRAIIACVTCRRRKVRCDVQVKDGTCTNCALDKVICQIDLSKEGPAKESDKKHRRFYSASKSNEGRHMSRVDGDLISSPSTVALDSLSASPKPDASKPWYFASQKFRRELVHGFLCHVYPSLPIITFHQLAEIAMLPEEQVPSCGRFVMNALMAASVKFLDDGILRECGIPSRHCAFVSYFTIAKSLFHFELAWESYTSIQGLLLLSYCDIESSNQTAFWLGLAYAMAAKIQLGNEPTQLRQPETGFRKRLWWCLFSQTVLLELTTGRPSSVKMDLTNVSMLNDDDFESIVPSMLLSDENNLGPLLSDEVRFEVGRQFMRWLDFFRGHYENPSSDCTDDNYGELSSVLGIEVSSYKQELCVLRSIANKNLESRSGSPAHGHKLGEEFHVSDVDPETINTLLEVERHLYKPTFGLSGLDTQRRA